MLLLLTLVLESLETPLPSPLTLQVLPPLETPLLLTLTLQVLPPLETPLLLTLALGLLPPLETLLLLTLALGLLPPLETLLLLTLALEVLPPLETLLLLKLALGLLPPLETLLLLTLALEPLVVAAGSAAATASPFISGTCPREIRRPPSWTLQCMAPRPSPPGPTTCSGERWRALWRACERWRSQTATAVPSCTQARPLVSATARWPSAWPASRGASAPPSPPSPPMRAVLTRLARGWR
jgi:hypothetical protein